MLSVCLDILVGLKYVGALNNGHLNPKHAGIPGGTYP